VRGVQVLLGQIPIAARDQAANVHAIAAAIDGAPDAALAVFPEMALPGYDTHALGEVALPLPAPDQPGDLPEPLATIAEAAARQGTAVIVGFAEATPDGTFRNSAACIDEHGELAGIYRKTHLFGDAETAAFAPGDAYLLTTLAGVRVGVQICFDTEFPEPARAMAIGGAELLVTISANMAPYDLEHRLGAAARAIENRLPHVYVNRCGQESGFDFLGDSAAIDAGGRDLLRLGAKPQLALAEVPIGAETIGEVDYLRLLTPPLPLHDASRAPA
jgi:(R)-amidase